MTPERLLSAAEHQALDLIESRLERDDRRLADWLAHGFEDRGRLERLGGWLLARCWGVALVAAVVLVPLAALATGGPAFAGAVAVMAAATGVVVSGGTWGGHRIRRWLSSLAEA